MIKGVRTLKYGEIIPIIGEIFREGETGTLLLQNEPAAKYLYFQSGQVIFAASNAPEDKFTQILLEEGKLKEEQLDMAMQKKGSKTIAKTLTELGFISSPDLLDSLIMQVYRIANSVVRWTEGSASFKPDVLPQGVAKLPLSTQRLIMDLCLSVENRSWALEIVGGMDKVVSIHKAEMDVALALPLTSDEEKIIKFCDGKRSVDEIAASSGSDPFRTIKLLIGLHLLGLAKPKRLIEGVNAPRENPESQKEEKHLDLSFLEQALPNKEEPAPPANEVAAAALKIDDKPQFKVETIEEEPVEAGKEVIQPPLFQPNFLPVDERKIGEIREAGGPGIMLSPENPLPGRSHRHRTPLMVSGIVLALLAGTLIIYFTFFSTESEKNYPPPQAPPKLIPKNAVSKPQTGIAQDTGLKKEAPKTAPVESLKPPAPVEAAAQKPAAPPPSPVRQLRKSNRRWLRSPSPRKSPRLKRRNRSPRLPRRQRRPSPPPKTLRTASESEISMPPPPGSRRYIHPKKADTQ
jgi:hypothetical protein